MLKHRYVRLTIIVFCSLPNKTLKGNSRGCIALEYGRKINTDLDNSVIVGTIIDDGKGLLKSSSSNSNNVGD